MQGYIVFFRCQGDLEFPYYALEYETLSAAKADRGFLLNRINAWRAWDAVRFTDDCDESLWMSNDALLPRSGAYVESVHGITEVAIYRLVRGEVRTQ